MGGPGARIVIGRDTRESGRGSRPRWPRASSPPAARLRAGVLPTPGVAVLARLAGAELGCVISASHNPYQDNGIKFLGGDGRKLDDAAEAAIEALDGRAPAAPAAASRARGRRRALRRRGWARPSAAACTGGAGWCSTAPTARPTRPRPRCSSGWACAVGCIGAEPDGRNINPGVGSTHLEARRRGWCETGRGLRHRVRRRRRPLPGGGRRRPAGQRRRDHRGAAIDLPRAAAAGDRVVVTSMTNLGFHRLMREHGIAVEVTDVGDRYVLERMLATGAALGGEQSGHVLDLAPPHHRRRPGDRPDAAGARWSGWACRWPPPPTWSCRSRSVWSRCRPTAPRYRRGPDLAGGGRCEAKLGERGRILLRASGTEPLVRVMVEARGSRRGLRADLRGAACRSCCRAEIGG